MKTYSSGMYMRLGFAVAIHVDPDVLLVDEVLAVGDEGFTHKCLDKFGEFRRRGKTILLVTHSLGLVERFCDEALWIDGGVRGRTAIRRRVVGAYMTDVEKAEEQSLASRGRSGRMEQCRQRAAEAGLRGGSRGGAAKRRTTCSARAKAAGDRARSRSPASRSSAPTASRRTSSSPATR